MNRGFSCLFTLILWCSKSDRFLISLLMKQARIPHALQNTKIWTQNNAKMSIISSLNYISLVKKKIIIIIHLRRLPVGARKERKEGMYARKVKRGQTFLYGEKRGRK